MGRKQRVLHAFILVGALLQNNGTPAAADVEPIAIVTSAAGSATLERATASERKPVVFKDTVMAGDRIVTGDQSTLRLFVARSIVVTVGERADVRIASTPALSIELRQGMIAVAVGGERVGSAAMLEVRTPNLIAVQGPGVSLVEARPDLRPLASRVISISGALRVAAPAASGFDDTPIVMSPLTSLVRSDVDPLGAPTTLTRSEAEHFAAGLRMRLMPAAAPANELVAERNLQAVGADAAPMGEIVDRIVGGKDRAVGPQVSGDDLRQRQMPRGGGVPGAGGTSAFGIGAGGGVSGGSGFGFGGVGGVIGFGGSSSGRR
jgi:hypothetical protein